MSKLPLQESSYLPERVHLSSFQLRPILEGRDSEFKWCINSNTALQVDGGTPDQDLQYTDDFINARHPVLPGYTVPSSLLPNIEDEVYDEPDAFGDATRSFWKGIICPSCGNCCPRVQWKGWSCRCGYTRDTGNRVLYTARMLADPNRDRFTGPPVPQLENPFKVPVQVSFRGTTTITRYDLNTTIGSVIHIQPSETFNKEVGIDQILLDYQNPDLPFKRHQLQTGMSSDLDSP